MALRSVLGLFNQADDAAQAVDNLKEAGFGDNDYDIMTGTPYPEGAFGEPHGRHRLYTFPFIGALCGFSVALLLTAATQLNYPMVTGGKPILAIPAMLIVMYEGTMLGAIIFTVLGVLFESRVPRLGLGLFDRRITEGAIGVVVSCDEARLGQAETALREAGAAEVKQGRRG